MWNSKTYRPTSYILSLIIHTTNIGMLYVCFDGFKGFKGMKMCNSQKFVQRYFAISKKLYNGYLRFGKICSLLWFSMGFTV